MVNATRWLLIVAIVLAVATAAAVRWRDTWTRFKAGMPQATPTIPEWTGDRTAIFGAFADIAYSNPDLNTAFKAIAQEEECA